MKKIEYIESYTDDVFEILKDELDWISTGAPREEYFMSDSPATYTYGRGNGERTYHSKPFHPVVKDIMNKLNEDFDSSYDICFLNYYTGQKKHLDWHADDSDEIDTNHPIAVISFGDEREIYWKKQGEKGVVPPSQRQFLSNGSLFIMPANFQEDHLHKIPKNPRADCGGRISLTFRKFNKAKHKENE